MQMRLEGRKEIQEMSRILKSFKFIVKQVLRIKYKPELTHLMMLLERLEVISECFWDMQWYRFRGPLH